MAPTSLKLLEFSDRELLWVLEDATDGNGGVTSRELHAELGLDKDAPARSVGSRLSWLRRYGAVEREGMLWRLSEEGKTLLHGTLSPGAAKALERLGPEGDLALADQLATRYRMHSPTAGDLIRREWLYGTGGGKSRSVVVKRKAKK